MRMWSVDPRVMCTKHLLGEHVEMHMFVGTIRRGISMQGYIDNGLVETERIKARHDELAAEMLRRGMKHQSPMIDEVVIADGVVDVEANLRELARRCPECAELQRSRHGN